MSIKINDSLKVATLNIRGLRNNQKLRTVLRAFTREKLDIISMQETFLLSERDNKEIDNLWKGKVHFSPATSHNSKGLITLFSPKYNDNDISIIYMSERIIISSIIIDNEKFYIVNIYSPCGQNDKIAFLDEIFNCISQYISDLNNANLICLGDFNLAAGALDVIGGLPHSDNVRQGFAAFMQKLDLTDTWRLAHPSESTFSWMRGSTSKRLDYLLVSESLIDIMSDSQIKNIGFSDHRMVITSFEASKFKRGKGFYKINTSLLHDQDYCTIIVNEIRKTIHDYRDADDHTVWEMIKINIKEISQRYSIKKNGEKRNKRKDLDKQLSNLENEYINNPNDKSIIDRISSVKSELEILELAEARGAQIRSGMKDIKEGEKCTKLFLAMEKYNANNNTIKEIRDQSGDVIKNEKCIVKEIGRQFEKRYNKPTQPKEEVNRNLENFTNNITLPSLNREEKEFCDAQMSEREIAETIRVMKNGSAPGADGIPIEIYKMFWQHIRIPLMNCIRLSFASKKLPYSERLGVIALFHKGKDLAKDNVDNWRPITLTNADYKIIAKALSRRLDKVIEKLIGQQQMGFMKGRNISNIHRIIDDILDTHRLTDTSGIIMAIDFKQAFDAINIDCILKTLNIFGFGNYFTDWISILNTERLACVKNGGHVSQPFSMSNGVRQGCPISPQLFILAVEILAQKIIQDPNIKGLNPHNSNKPLKLEQYADDTSLFLKDCNDLRRAMGHLDSFSAFSGLYLNLQKSYALSTNGRHIDTEGMEITFKSTIKILGLFFSNRKSANEIEENWLSRIATVKKIFREWSKRNVSLIGKILIIKTFGLSQLIFVMKSIVLPQNVLGEINTMFFKFLWSNSSINNNVSEKVKRTVMFNDYSSGGLKMIDIIKFQESIMLEWVENLLSEESCHWKALPIFFFKNLGGVNVFRCNVPPEQFQGLNLIKSTFWRAILMNWLKHTHGHNSNTVSLDVPLHNNTAFTYRNKPLFLKSSIRKSCTLLRDVLRNNHILNLVEYRTKFGHYPGDFLDHNIIFNAVSRLDLQSIRQNFSLSFKGDKIGKLGRKHFYSKILFTEIPRCNEMWNNKFDINFNSSDWSLIFKLKESRLRILSWKIIHNIYPTKLALFRMNIKEDNLCSWCDNNTIDNTEHFFFECPIVKPLWVEIEKDINTYMGKNLRLEIKAIILGPNYIPTLTNKELIQLNHVIAVGKLSISKFKYGPQRNIVEIYKTDSMIRKLWQHFV